LLGWRGAIYLCEVPGAGGLWLDDGGVPAGWGAPDGPVVDVAEGEVVAGEALGLVAVPRSILLVRVARPSFARVSLSRRPVTLRPSAFW
jgi:hypothetical protein